LYVDDTYQGSVGCSFNHHPKSWFLSTDITPLIEFLAC
jgi:hypothetical protein